MHCLQGATLLIDTEEKKKKNAEKKNKVRVVFLRRNKKIIFIGILLSFSI